MLNWIGDILRRDCLLKLVIEGMTQGIGGQGSRRMQLLHNLRYTTRYWILKERALVGTFWITCFGIVYGLIARQTA